MADWLKKRRNQLGLSQAELAARLELAGFSISPGAISHWETDRYDAPLDDPAFRRAIAQALQMRVSDLLLAAGYELPSNYKSEAARRVADIVEHLPPEGQKLALDQVEALEEYFFAQKG